MESYAASMVTSPGLSRVPRSSKVIIALLMFSSMVGSATLGFDSSMMNALNILPSYTDYFNLNTATLGLNTAAVNIGGALSGFVGGYIIDRWGRKCGIYVGCALTLIAVLLQTAAQNVAMFVIARIIIGLGVGIENTAIAVFLGELVPYNYRDYLLGAFNDCWYIGGLTSSGITYGTANMSSTWAWRLPSAIQAIWSIVTLATLMFLPESPRWLVYQDRFEEAFEVVALTHSDGDKSSGLAQAQFKEIVDTIRHEKESNQQLGFIQTMKTPSSRKRMELMFSVEIMTCFTGSSIISYYLGTMLENAGVTNSTTKLQISIILNAWCFVVSIIGTYCTPLMSRKFLASLSTALPMIFIFMIGMMTKLFGDSTNTSGIYGTVAFIFLFQGSYSFGWTTLTYLYPIEVLNYSIRGAGMTSSTFLWNSFGFITTFAFPFAVESLGWKVYMLNGTWDCFELAYIVTRWVETRGKTLEEIDAIFDGEKHSDVPDLEAIARGKILYTDGVVIPDSGEASNVTQIATEATRKD